MDPLSIASSALELSTTCFRVSTGIQKYVEDVRGVDKTIALFGQDMKALSGTLSNVHNFLKKYESSLSSKLRDESDLFDSLNACLRDCSNTVKQILDMLNDGQTHGRVGQALGRMATHWKIKEKTDDLITMRSRVLSFQTALNMNLEMIHICMTLQAQKSNETRQHDVLNGITQLRGQIDTLTKMQQLRQQNGKTTLPATVQNSLNAAIALDDTQSGRFSTTTQKPSDQRNQQARIGRDTHTAPSSMGPSRSNSGYGSSQPGPNYPQSSHMQASQAPRLPTSEVNYKNELRTAREFLKDGRIEPAKSICRKVIHETEFKFGVNHPSHREALDILAHLYEYTADKQQAQKLRLLLDTPGRNSIRKEFKSLMKEQTLEKTINYVYSWAVLLDNNAKLQMYGNCLKGLQMDKKFKIPVLFAAVSMMGNNLFAQSLLAEGSSIHSQVYCNWSMQKTITPLGCAIRLGHQHLVQTLLEAGSDNLDSIINTQCVEHAIECWNAGILRMLLDHMCIIRDDLRGRNMPSDRSFQLTNSKKLEMGMLLSKRLERNPGALQSIQKALHDAVQRKDLTMARLLSEYGLGGTSVIKTAIQARWMEGIRTLATEKNNVTEDDISYALGQDLSIAKYLLSLNPSLATNCISHAMSGSGVEGLKLVLRMGANVNAPAQYPLHLAVRSKNSQMVQTLLSAGADVHRKDGEGQTALQYAIKIGKNSHDDKVAFQAMLDIISLLRKSGATASSGGGSSLGWGMSSKSRQLSAALRV